MEKNQEKTKNEQKNSKLPLFLSIGGLALGLAALIISLVKPSIPGPAGQDGQNGLPGQNGQDGQPGQPGTPGTPGVTPHIDETTGNWFIGDTDTGIHAQGPQGESAGGKDGLISFYDFRNTLWESGVNPNDLDFDIEYNYCGIENKDTEYIDAIYNSIPDFTLSTTSYNMDNETESVSIWDNAITATFKTINNVVCGHIATVEKHIDTETELPIDNEIHKDTIDFAKIDDKYYLFFDCTMGEEDPYTADHAYDVLTEAQYHYFVASMYGLIMDACVNNVFSTVMGTLPTDGIIAQPVYMMISSFAKEGNKYSFDASVIKQFGVCSGYYELNDDNQVTKASSSSVGDYYGNLLYQIEKETVISYDNVELTPVSSIGDRSPYHYGDTFDVPEEPLEDENFEFDIMCIASGIYSTIWTYNFSLN